MGTKIRIREVEGHHRFIRFRIMDPRIIHLEIHRWESRDRTPPGRTKI